MSLPRVTEILKPWMKLDWIPEEALARGQKRHAAFAAYLLGAWAPAVDPRDQGQLESFKRWVYEYVVKVLAVEISLEDPDLGFAGTLDAILELTLSPCAVIDFKPPSALTRPYQAQLSAYEHLAHKNGYWVVQSGFLRPDSDGGIAKVDWLEGNPVPFFLSALNCHRFFKGG